jgi:phage protein D
VQDEIRSGKLVWLGHEDNLFKFGNEVSIKLGYVGNLGQTVQGQIQNISAEFFTGASPTFTVEGRDKAYKLLLERSEARVFRQKKDSDVVREIAQELHLSPEVDSTDDAPADKTKQNGTSYYDFIKTLVSRNRGFQFYLSEQSLFFVKERRADDPILTLRWGRELMSFRPSLSSAQAVSEVIVRGWDRTRKRPIEGHARAGEEGRQEEGRRLASQVARDIYGDVVRVIDDRPVRSPDDARRIALGELQQASNEFITGSSETIGIPEITPGVCVSLEGVGDWFSGKYFVKKSTHTIDASGYRTTFEFRRNAV